MYLVTLLARPSARGLRARATSLSTICDKLSMEKEKILNQLVVSLSLSLSLSPTHTHTLSFSLSGCRLLYHRPTHTLVFSTSVYNVFMPRIGSPWNKVLGHLSPPTCRFSCYNWILSSLNIYENGWNYSQEVYFEKERILAFLWFQFMKVLSS